MNASQSKTTSGPVSEPLARPRIRESGSLERIGAKVLARLAQERGDVPGWVLVTLMTAGLVVLLWSLAGPALKGVFDQALAKVAQF